jgi:hypothetical protein
MDPMAEITHVLDPTVFEIGSLLRRNRAAQESLPSSPSTIWCHRRCITLTSMNIGWAVDSSGARPTNPSLLCTHRPKLYEALDFLEKSIEPAWLVRRYRFTELILFPFVAPVP